MNQWIYQLNDIAWKNSSKYGFRFESFPTMYDGKRLSNANKCQFLFVYKVLDF